MGQSKEGLCLHALNAPSAGAALEEEEEISWLGWWGMSPAKEGMQELADMEIACMIMLFIMEVKGET